ncbi:S-adenosyl-L-methionine-dependent methyltransferase [Aspergillus sclerotiicarbonarius CBS 121057]|uniref:S-adenosyl-L-methionine-dependent methyltransferase n=1 Tax=Aspergillus sclerotiicarbonarius (strain CBS 121057 / IBT 28362) TaxID=1448318 RepID=A0A319EZP8_ASPSB|nr:S-adenosyl-L-methionine-dependent methyltransferase [Aspergillus sclerotiicarbonarius CBS 121057]
MATQVLTKSYLHEARASSNIHHCMEIYDQWAATYNDEVGNKDQDYVAPTLVASAALNSSSGSIHSVLDAGCGTGLVGQALAMAGAKTIDGLDLSPAMLDMAKRTGVYRKLVQGDLTRGIDMADEGYDVIVCVGTFTLGHVGPQPALREFVRVVRRGGVVAATVLEEIWVSGGFRDEVETLEEEGRVVVLRREMIDYVKGHGDKAMLFILRRVDEVKG